MRGRGWRWSDKELGIVVSGSGVSDSHGRQRRWLGYNCRCVNRRDGSKCHPPGSKGIGDIECLVDVGWQLW